MGLKKRCFISVILAVILSLSLATPAMAVPQIPHAFYGSVTVGDEPAPDDVIISAKIGGVEYVTTNTSDGRYGYSPTFKVPADDPDTPEVEGGVEGDSIEFYLGSIKAQLYDVETGESLDSYPFKSGDVTEINLTVTAPPLIAEAGGPYSGRRGANIALSGSASGGITPYTFAWNLNNDGAYDDATGATPSYSWGTSGTFTIGLRVTDSASVTATDTATVTVTAPAGGGGGAGPAYLYTETELFGAEARFRIKSDGEILAAIEATSADGLLTMTIPKGTIALGKDGKRLKSLQAAVDESPPDPPEDAHIIGLAYDFGPDGATFDPEITLVWSYDPDALPEDVAEEDLVVAYYADEWVEVDCVVDTENDTITASVEHFTTFAIIGAVTPPEEEEVAPPEEEEVAPPVEVPVKPAAFTTSSLSIFPTEADIGQSVTISVLVANTGDVTGSYEVTLKINNVAVATQDVTLAGGASQTVTFTTAKDAAGTYTVNIDGLSGTLVVKAPPVEVPAPINWPLIGGIIAAVVVVALLIYFLVVRRRAA